MARLLVVDDERTQRALLERFLTNDGYEVESASDGAAALELVQSTPVDLVITDLRMPGMNGRELLAKLQQLDPTLPVIIMTAYADLRDAVDFVTHAGAFYYIEKPIEDMKILRGEIERALAAKEKPHAHASEASEPSELGESVFPEMIGNSSPMARLKREMQKLLPILGGPATVLITGESGTGKELVAEALHRYGPRKNAPFVPVHCAAIPDDLMEAELFGSERGAYTGSTGTRAGYFEEADGGTIFLDEIGEINLMTQVKILRVLASREYYRVGSSRPRAANVCVVAATNRHLEDEVKEGRFREDLFYRLNVFRLHVPPLRDRRDDIPGLVEHLLKRFTSQFGLSRKGFSKDAISTLRRFHWAGNIRQLDHYLQQAVVMSDADTVNVADLPSEADEPTSGEPIFLSEVIERGMSLEEVERQLILGALDRVEGNQTKAADLLGVSRRKFQYRMDKHGISSRNYRDGGNGDHGDEDDEEE